MNHLWLFLLRTTSISFWTIFGCNPKSFLHVFYKGVVHLFSANKITMSWRKCSLGKVFVSSDICNLAVRPRIALEQINMQMRSWLEQKVARDWYLRSTYDWLSINLFNKSHWETKSYLCIFFVTNAKHFLWSIKLHLEALRGKQFVFTKLSHLMEIPAVLLLG